MTQKKNLKFAFFGTPHFAVYVLEELEKAGVVPALVVTVPDKPAERGLEMKSSEVKKWALTHNTRLLQPEKLEPEHSNLSTENFDLFIVAAYGKILPKEILSLPKFGTLNVHPSLLPKFRGPSPIESAILADEKETGVSIILLDEETDHGPVLAQAKVAPESWPARRGALKDLLWQTGGKLLADSIPTYIEGSLKPRAQDHSQATFTPKLKKEDGLLDLNADGYKNYLKFCAYEGWPGTYFFVTRNGKEVRVKIVDAKYESGVFTPTRIIPEGKKEMSYTDFLRA